MVQLGKETSKGNLRKWGNPCFYLFCCQAHELLGSSAPYGWDSNDPGDLLLVTDGLGRGLLDGVQSMFLHEAQAFGKDCQGRKELSIGGFQLHASCDILPKRRPRVTWCSVSMRPVPFTPTLHYIRHPDSPVSNTGFTTVAESKWHRSLPNCLPITPVIQKAKCQCG